MSSWSWLRNLFSPLLLYKRGGRGPQRRAARITKRVRPAVEVLEDRTMPNGGPILPPVAHFGNALALDGNASYAEAGSAVPTSGDFTVSVWVQTDASQTDLEEFVSQGTSGNAFYIGRVNGDIRVSDGWIDTGVRYPTDGQWHNLTVVNTSTTAYLYRDGNLAALHASLPNPTTGAFRFGRQYGGYAEYATGDLDEVQVWNRALTQAEIQSDMLAPLTSSQNGLVGYWQFDEPSGLTAVDASSSGNNATFMNGATRVASTLGPAIQTNENTPISGTLDAHDANGDPLTFSIVGSGELGTATFTNAATGAFTYTPSTGIFGTDTFSYAAIDGQLESNVVTVTITINPGFDAPMVTGTETQEGVETTSGLVISENGVSEGPAPSFYQITNIQGGTLYQNDGATVIQNGDFIAAGQGGAGLKFDPNQGESSPSSIFSFNVQGAFDTNSDSLIGTVSTAFINVDSVALNAAPVDHFVISASDSSPDAGSPLRFDVIAEDAAGARVTNYHGTVHFTSNDPQGVLPANYTFTDADQGDAVFFATLNTAGLRTLTVTDAAHSNVAGQTGLNVRHGAAAQFAITGFPADALVGSTQTFTVTAEDSFGNVADDYVGVVHFGTLTSALVDSTPDALPADYAFQTGDNGSHSFTITLNHGGYNFIRATDVLHSSITGAETVRARPVLDVAGGSVVETVNQAFTVAVVTIEDASPEPLANYQATIHWGDGTGRDSESRGVITAMGPGEFTVTGTHTYQSTDTFLAYVVVTAAGKRVESSGDFDVVVLEPSQAGTVAASVVGRITREQVEAAAEGVPLGFSLQASTDGLTSAIVESNVGRDGAALFMAHYGNNPTSGTVSNLAATTTFYDLRVTGLGADARLTATFSFPSGATGSSVALSIFDPATNSFVSVRGSKLVPNSYVVDPVARTIRVTFDRSSLPMLTSLTGTVFSVSVSAPPADSVTTTTTTQVSTGNSSLSSSESVVANALTSTSNTNATTSTSVTITVSPQLADRSNGDGSGSRRTVTFETSSELTLSLTAAQDSASSGRDETAPKDAAAPAEEKKTEMEETQGALKRVLDFLRDFRMPVEHGTKTGALGSPIGDWLLPVAAARPDVEVTDLLFSEAEFDRGQLRAAAFSLLGGVWYSGERRLALTPQSRSRQRNRGRGCRRCRTSRC